MLFFDSISLLEKWKTKLLFYIMLSGFCFAGWFLCFKAHTNYVSMLDQKTTLLWEGWGGKKTLQIPNQQWGRGMDIPCDFIIRRCHGYDRHILLLSLFNNK